jgi:opacity protein-like surface antigen
MFGKKNVAALFAAVAFASVPVLAQSEEAGKNEVAVQYFGSFLKSTTNNGIENKSTNSGGVLATYRYNFTRHQGVEANYGYTLNTQNFGTASGVSGIRTNSHEVTAAYVYRIPLAKFTPFVLAGAGALVFDPKDVVGVTTQTRAAFVYGGGADFNISHHLFARAEYRGFVYNSPTFDLPAYSGTDRLSHRAEPSIGLGYRF